MLSVDQALALARSRNLDLVEIAPNADPPVVKIMDFGKYRYELQKKEKEQRKKQARTSELKEIRFRPNTDDHDFEFKAKHAREFLEDGHKVKAWVQFRGRDIIYKERGANVLERFVETLSDVAKLDQAPTMEGRRMTIMLAPGKVAPPRPAYVPPPAAAPQDAAPQAAASQATVPEAAAPPVAAPLVEAASPALAPPALAPPPAGG